MTFDPKKYVIKVQGGREYLPVSARLVWFRSEKPDWGIVTTPIEINLEKQYAIFSCSIFNAEGKVMATATKMEDVRGFGDYLEKAETGSVGRALAYCGYGTQFAPELEEGRRLADAPYPSSGNRFAPSSGGNRPPMGNGGNGGTGNGNGMNRMPPRPMITNDKEGFAEAPEPPRMAAAPPPRPATPAPRPATPPPASNEVNGFTRVREPERQYAEPDTTDDTDDEDPFDEEEVIPAAQAPRAVGTVPRPAPTPAVHRDDEDSAPAAAAPRPNPLAGNHCSVEGCSNVLTPSQMTMATNKFGRSLCLLHQREAQPLAASGAGNGARRTAARPEPADTLL